MRTIPNERINWIFILVYFDSFDVNGDHIITRDDLEKCLPPTVESQELIQQLLRQWDVVRHKFCFLDSFHFSFNFRIEMAWLISMISNDTS